MGNTVSNTEGKRTVDANQVVNPLVLAEADKSNGKSGTFMFHELTEAYEGAKISKFFNKSSEAAGVFPNNYGLAHLFASFQPSVREIAYGINGKIVRENDVTKVWIVYDTSGNPHTIQKLRIQ